MTPADALAILQDIWSAPIAHRVPGCSLRLVVRASDDARASGEVRVSDDGRATVALEVFENDQLRDVKEQELPIVPEADDVPLDPARHRAFATGVRMAAAACDPEATLPHDLLLVSLLRTPLDAAPAFAEAIAQREVRAGLLAPIEVGDRARRDGLAPINEPDAQRDVWILMSGSDAVDEVEGAARRLVERSDPATVPYLLGVLEEWQVRMYETGGLSWISDDERNVDVFVARILEPLLRSSTTPEATRRFETLEVAGMFDVEHETATYEWMFRS